MKVNIDNIINAVCHLLWSVIVTVLWLFMQRVVGIYHRIGKVHVTVQ